MLSGTFIGKNQMRSVAGRMSPEDQQAKNVLLGMTLSRPAAPATLTALQAAEWNIIVEQMPANWFKTEMLPLLEAYCVQIVRRRLVSAELNKLEERGKVNIRLRREENVAVRALCQLATKLRLTPQSRYDKTKKIAVPFRKPWEGGE
jgi:hypothetical protein